MNYKTAIKYLQNTIEFNNLEYGSVRQTSEVINFLKSEDRAAKPAEPPAIPQQPQGEICSNHICLYCENEGNNTVCGACGYDEDSFDLFKGRKLSPVR